MRYEVDLNQISLADFKALILGQKLMAGRRLLKVGIDAKFAAQTGVAAAELEEISALSDIVRLGGIGPVFTKIVYEAGFTDVYSIAAAAVDLIYERMVVLNDEKKYTRAMLSESDMQFCIDFARILTRNPTVEGVD